MDTRAIGEIVHRGQPEAEVSHQRARCMPAVTLALLPDDRRETYDLVPGVGQRGRRALVHDSSGDFEARGWHYPDECPFDAEVAEDHADGLVDWWTNQTTQADLDAVAAGTDEQGGPLLMTGHTLIRRQNLATDVEMACSTCEKRLYPGQTRIDVETPRRPGGLGHTAHACSRGCAIRASQRLAEHERVRQAPPVNVVDRTEVCARPECGRPLGDTVAARSTAEGPWATKLYCSAACAESDASQGWANATATACPEHPDALLLGSDHHAHGPTFYRHRDGSGHLNATSRLRTEDVGARNHAQRADDARPMPPRSLSRAGFRDEAALHARAAVLDLLGARLKPGEYTLTRHQIAKRTGLSQSRIAQVLHELVDTGAVVRSRARPSSEWHYRVLDPIPPRDRPVTDQDGSTTAPAPAPDRGPDGAPETATGPSSSPEGQGPAHE